jgi:hypothetical protein
MTNKFKILLGNSEEKRPPGRTKRRWDDAFKMNVKEVRSGSVEWIYVAQGIDQWRVLVNTAMIFFGVLENRHFLTL